MKFPGSQVFPEALGEDTATSYGTSVSDGGSAGTFSASFTEIVASMPYTAKGFWLCLHNNSGNFHEVKLYAGAASSEQEFAHVGGFCPANHVGMLYVPQAIPAGQRVSAKVASEGGFDSTRIHLLPARANGHLPLVGVSWLVGTTSAAPTGVDCGATAHTKSSWVQVTSSSHATRNAKGFSLAFAGDISCDTNNRQLWDIGLGSAGSEQVILQNFHASQEGYRGQLDPIFAGPFWTPIPAGTRIAARAQCSSNAASSRVPRIAVILWG